jgi:hypothetical protein
MQYIEQDVVINGSEEFPDITFQYPYGFTVSPRSVPRKISKSIQGSMSSFVIPAL